MEDSHCKTSEEVLKFFNTNDELGLTSEQVKQYQAKYGPNGELTILFIYLYLHFVIPLSFIQTIPSLIADNTIFFHNHS